jgi:branched-chain amino acid transport system substrate-binding protein
MIELITRDTQSDPTKAVNGAAELTRGQKVSAVFGPLNSGESLAVVPLLARANTPQIHPCWVDSLTDPKKYPMCFRNAPTNQQIGGAANRYVVDVLKLKKVAVISDTTGYGTASVNAYVPMLKAKGAEVVYQGNVDAANPDLKPELLRMQSAGAEAIMPWSVNAGFLSRIINTRGQMGNGTCRSSARPRSAPARPRPCWRSPNTGRRSIRTISARFATPRRQAPGSHRRLPRPAEDRQDRDGRHAAVVDRGRLRHATDDRRGDEERRHRARGRSSAISTSSRNSRASTATSPSRPEQHDGYPDDEVVMVEANSLKDGAFNLAPGYGA